jgi:hypothetical protein
MEVWIYIGKFILGGAFVCLFALVAEVCQPKRFAGIFSAAPSILLAGLAIALITQGRAHAQLTAEGAVVGALGMVASCLVAVPAIQRFKILRGVALSLLIWFGITFGIYALLVWEVGW